jgi:hypothetical protein
LIVAAIAIFACFNASAGAQLRDSFEGPDRTWQLTSEADCGVRVLAHDRSYSDARTGQSSEHFRLTVGNGTFVPVVHTIGRAPIIEEFRPSLCIKADRPGVQFMLRVVLPRSLDRGTGRPITTLLRGDLYAQVGQWQRLTIREPARLLEQETRNLRAQLGPQIDSREAYADLIVLNAYSGPGNIDLWIDDLEIEGYVNLDSTLGPQVARRPASPDAVPAEASPAPSVQGSLLTVRGRPLMPRAIQHQGEPLTWLKSLGFNTLKLNASPSAVELKEARREGLWFIAPSPYATQPLPEGDSEAVIAWSLGSRLTERDLTTSRELAAEVRNLDRTATRPLLAGVESGLNAYSRLAQLLALDRPTLGTSAELSDLRPWLLSRVRMARPGVPYLATIETQRSPRLTEQLLLLGDGAAVEEDTDPEQLRLAAFHALSAGARGLVFTSQQPLAIDHRAAALRTDARRLLNRELRLLEPWIAAGELTDEMAAGDGTLQVSVLATERSRLLLLTQHGAAQQYVLGPPPRSSVAVLAPGVSLTDKAYLVSLAGIESLQISHTSGGAQITLDKAPHAAAIVVTQDPLALHHLYRTLSEIKAEAARLRYDLAARRMAQTAEIDGRLTQLGHPLNGTTAALAGAQTSLQQAQRFLESRDYENCHVATTRAEDLVARIRRGHWEQAAGGFPSPAASPCVSQFTTLPLHWTLASRMAGNTTAGNSTAGNSTAGQFVSTSTSAAATTGATWGPNMQAAPDMESLDQMLKAGWQQQRFASAGIGAEVSLSLADPHSGRSALRLQAGAADPKRAPRAIERPSVWVVSSPVPVRQGQLVRIHGWADVPRPLAASSDGLVVFDSIGGADLAERIRLTRGWREFTLYRAAGENGDLTVTFALTGLGEASIDDLSVSLLDPPSIRAAR